MPSVIDEIRNDREKGAKRLENEYKAGLMALARRFCTNESDAEELVNSTFAVVIDNIDRYLEQSAFFGWMSRILVNIHAKGVRRMSNKMEFSSVDIPEEEPDDEACAKVFREVDAAILRDAIDRLPDDMKQTLMLHYFMDIPVGEVAKILSIPSGTVKWRLHYARKMLSAKLGAGVKKNPVVAIVAAALFLTAGAMVVTGVARAFSNADVLGSADAAVESVGGETPVEAGLPSDESPLLSSDVFGLSTLSAPNILPLQSISSQQGETTMNIRNTTATALTMAAFALPVASLASVFGGDDVAVALDSTTYVKVLEDAGPMAGRWSFKGITAWNGTAQVPFACVSNRPYASATMTAADAARGDMPTGNYVHQVSVFNQWDGLRTRSYRVQIAQPVGGNDIYARILAVTVSQPGVNLMDHPDIREIRTDSSKIEYYCSTSENKEDIANFPVTALRLVRQTGYVESEGDAFISLGHCAGPNTRIEVDMQLTEVKFQTLPFGSYGDALEADNYNHPMFELYVSHAGDEIPKFSWECSSSDGKRQAMNCDNADLERHVISFDGVTRTYTSKNVTSGGSAYTYTFPKALLGRVGSNPISVFGRGSSPVATLSSHFGGAAKMKVYGVNIYESGTLVKCFVPCIRGGVSGLKELLGGTFVTGIDVAKVKYGGDILIDKDDPYVSTRINDVYGGTVPGKRIYLDTGYYVKKNARVELDFAPLTPPWSTQNPYGNHLFMHAQGPNSQLMYFINLKQTSASPLYWKIGTYETTAQEIQFSMATDIRRTYTFNSNTFQVVTAGYTNLVRTVDAASSLKNDLSTYPLHLASYSNGSGLYAPMKIYGLKIFEGDALVKDFKPFVKNGLPGLVDALNPSDQRFFTTHGGGVAGTNLVAEAGGDLDSHTAASEREAYLEFPETGSGIDTGYSVGRNSCIEADFALWKAGGVRQELIDQNAGSDSSYVTFTSAFSSGKYSIWFKFADEAGTSAVIDTANGRKQYIADRYAGTLTIREGDSIIKTVTMAGSNTRPGGANTLKLGRLNAAMRLYGLKISESGNEVRNYVPCVTNGVAGLYETHTKAFFPLTGGKVSGKGYRGQEDEFATRPQPTRIKVNDFGTLSCFAPSAQSYEWYEDGHLIEGETGETLTLEWVRAKAKMGTHIHTYSVVPVYDVFGEKARGKAADATVEYAPPGTVLIIK